MRRLFRSVFLIVFMSGAVLAAFLLTGFGAYSALSSETLIAELSFRKRDDGAYDALLSTADRCSDAVYVVHGEQWRVDAQFLKWKYWANLLGAESRYRLVRVEGRYEAAVDENSKASSAHDLVTDSRFDLARLAEQLGSLNPLFDAAYGSSTFEAIDPDRVFRVYKTQSGIITRSEPAVDALLVGEYLDIEIDRACGQSSSRWSGLFSFGQ